MAPNHYIFYLIAISVGVARADKTSETSKLNEDVTDFTSKLEDIKEKVIGVQAMQDLIDRVAFKEYVIDGNQRINQLADYMARGFGDRFDEVKRIQKIAVTLYENETLHNPNSPIKFCCELDSSELEYDPVYRTKVSTNQLCLRKTNKTITDVITLPNFEKLLEVFKENANREGMKSLKWQYIGTEHGVTVVYPAHQKNKQCGSYDPRFRPWYVEAATTIPKDVVIVIDRSMRNDSKLNIIKEAAKIVIDTLSPSDKVGVVLFSSSTEQPEGNGENCYQSELVDATPDVRKFLKTFINDITLEDSTRYIPALEAAFDYFTVVDTRNMVILFLTDGIPNETENIVLDRLSQLNAAKQNKVLILTFGLGNDVNDDLLKDMAEMNGYNVSAGPVTKKGEYTHISNNEDLRYQMTSYYNYFASIENKTLPITTVPYIDYTTLEHIFSICRPITGKDAESDAYTNLIGVACIDMTLSDITNEFEFLHRSSNAYVFIIDSNGQTLYHPMLPIPGLDFQSDPLFVEIKYLEPEAHSAGILDNMTQGTDGNETIEATLTTNQGFAPLHGVKNEKRKTTYIWRAVNGTGLSVAIVMTDRDVDLRIETMNAANTFTYHQFCNISVCTNKGKESTIEYSSTHLSSRAFKKNSIARTGCDFGKNISKYMTDSQQPSDKIHVGIRELYAVISDMIPKWKDNHQYNQYNDAIYERFIASHSGIFTVFPGTTISTDYDHTITDWYITAYSNQDKLVFTPPRGSEFGRQNVVTIAHTMFEGKTEGHTSDDLTIGVIGMNVDASFIEVYLHRSIRQCSQHNAQYRCMLMDTSGFLIYHPDADMQYLHIAELEQNIAHDMIQAPELHTLIHKCNDFAWKQQYSTWHFEITKRVNREFYELIPFSNTNIILIILDTLNSEVTPGICHSCNITSYRPHDVTKIHLSECKRVDSSTCNCPCYSELNYDPCENLFGIETSFPICNKPVFPDQKPVTIANISNAQRCYPVECGTYTNELDCRLRPECDWNSNNSNNSSCYEKSKIVIAPKPPVMQGSSRQGSDTSNSGAIVGSTLAVLFLLALVGVGIFLFLKFRNKEPPKFIADYKVYNPSGNPIYDELHFAVPSEASSRTVTPTSSISTEVGSLPRAVDVMNPAFRHNDTSEAALSGFPVVEPVTIPIPYSTVLTSQYLTHSSVVPVGNIGTPQSKLQSPTCQPVVEPASSPEQHTQELTSQYLTHSSVVPVGNIPLGRVCPNDIVTTSSEI